MRIGTRGSPLALWQARHFASVARAVVPALAEDGALEEHIIATSGDKVQDKRLADIGGKGLFAKEIHEALADGRMDLETELPPGIVLACVLEREDPRDALILGAGCGAATADDPLAVLPQGALVGTASVRRQAQLLHRRPDLRVDIIRGNVQTRLGRVAAGDFTCSLLALAGLKRLGMADRAQVVLDPEAMLPAACQGIVGITARADDAATLALLARIEHTPSRLVADAERALLGALDGSCRTPIGAHATLLADGRLRLYGLVARADGSFLRRNMGEAAAKDGPQLGRDLAAALKRESPVDIFG
jgi:hydroxymethylbilane synthase